MAHTIHTGGGSVVAAIGGFRDFLNSTWPVIAAILEDHDWDDDAYFLEDWLDANWQLLVARQLLGKDGDLQPFAVATNDVTKKRFAYRFESPGERRIFVSLGAVRKSFEIAPPFDMMKVMNQNGSIEILPWLSLEFELRKVIPG